MFCSILCVALRRLLDDEFLGYLYALETEAELAELGSAADCSPGRTLHATERSMENLIDVDWLHSTVRLPKTRLTKVENSILSALARLRGLTADGYPLPNSPLCSPPLTVQREGFACLAEMEDVQNKRVYLKEPSVSWPLSPTSIGVAIQSQIKKGNNNLFVLCLLHLGDDLLAKRDQGSRIQNLEHRQIGLEFHADPIAQLDGRQRLHPIAAQRFGRLEGLVAAESKTGHQLLAHQLDRGGQKLRRTTVAWLLALEEQIEHLKFFRAGLVAACRTATVSRGGAEEASEASVGPERGALLQRDGHAGDEVGGGCLVDHVHLLQDGIFHDPMEQRLGDGSEG